MSKRAIYFDDHERECARQMFDYLSTQLEAEPTNASALTVAARKWTKTSVDRLRAKFEEDQPK